MSNEQPKVTPTDRWMSLTAGERRRLLAITLARSALAVAGLLAAYYVAPFGAGSDEQIAVEAVVGGVIVLLALALQIRGVATADYPTLRAVEGLALVVPLVILVFAATYLMLSASDGSAFTEHLDHTGALYYAVTTSATVGFGDIAARSDAARIVVMIQMVASVVVLGLIVKLLLGSARRRSDQRP